MSPDPAASPSPTPPESDFTGDLFELTYQELRRLAQSLLVRETRPQTLQATALVHEAWLRLSHGRSVEWVDKRHFFCVAAEAMRRILIDRARSRDSQRHGGRLHRTELTDDLTADLPAPEILVAVDEALQEFAGLDPTKAELVRLRFYAGLPMEEIASLMAISPTTAKRHWSYARAWLQDRVNELLNLREPSGE